jgi:hypothetical protein
MPISRNENLLLEDIAKKRRLGSEDLKYYESRRKEK